MEEVEALDNIVWGANGLGRTGIQPNPIASESLRIISSMNEEKPTQLKSKTQESVRINPLKRLDGNNRPRIPNQSIA